MMVSLLDIDAPVLLSEESDTETGELLRRILFIREGLVSPDVVAALGKLLEHV
jgi:hypothetical protein